MGYPLGTLLAARQADERDALLAAAGLPAWAVIEAQLRRRVAMSTPRTGGASERTERELVALMQEPAGDRLGSEV